MERHGICSLSSQEVREGIAVCDTRLALAIYPAENQGENGKNLGQSL